MPPGQSLASRSFPLQSLGYSSFSSTFMSTNHNHARHTLRSKIWPYLSGAFMMRVINALVCSRSGSRDYACVVVVVLGGGVLSCQLLSDSERIFGKIVVE